MNKWIGEKDDFRRVRCSTQDFALLIFSRRVFASESLRTPMIHGCHASIDVKVSGYNMLWVQLQAGGGMQSNTDRSRLLIPFTSAPNTWQNRNQALRHAGHAAPGHRSEEICAFYSSKQPKGGYKIPTSRQSTHNETWNFLRPRNDKGRTDKWHYPSRIAICLLSS